MTGGSSGIGLATAEEFLARGARVVITGRRQGALDAAAATLGENVTAVRTDVADGPEMDALFELIRTRFGRLDHVIANAGSGHHSRLGSITDEEFDATIATNLKGTLYSVQKALPLLEAGASITIVGSIGSIHPPSGMSLYGGAKAALRNYVRSWIQDIKGSGIRINVLSPGVIDTESNRKSLTKAFGADRLEEQLSLMGEGSPLGRIGSSGEVAKAIAFLSSADASFIHGVELFVDGGLAQV
ncbi:SDR family oxidoreductase [Streptomyces globisporus]|uniref:SDR family NAD(P)-dependent oxidoreductase n=1 Tax=Streptomyces globisporus TaxID=1908 RepID=UPI003864D2C4|nr:SDR family oxidoreductase [Streptomyces globisporus]